MNKKIKLITPPNNWKNPILISEEDNSLLHKIAVANDLTYNYKKKQSKVYLGLRDREASEPLPEVKEDLPSLKVPYYSQRDSQVPGQWWRSCFSSAVAMAVKYVKPGVLSDSPNADDEHLRRVMQHSDTTNPDAQIYALNHYKIKAKKVTNFSFKDLDELLENNTPVPIGILIKGNVNYPTGGGHWITVIGKTETGYICHDPYGELDLIDGVYLHSNGKSRHYSKENLGKRWMIEGNGSGWAIKIDR